MFEGSSTWAARTCGSLVGIARRTRVQRRTINELCALDDRTLKDIGIPRSGIIAAAYQLDRQ